MNCIKHPEVTISSFNLNNGQMNSNIAMKRGQIDISAADATRLYSISLATATLQTGAG